MSGKNLIAAIMDKLNVSLSSAYKILNNCIDLGIIEKKNKNYVLK